MEQQVSNWRKSTRSANGGEQCVELGTTSDGVAVRDTVDQDGFTLSVPAAAWTRFLATIR